MVVEPDEVLLPSAGFVVLLSEGAGGVLPGNGPDLSVLLDFCPELEFPSLLKFASVLPEPSSFPHPPVINKIDIAQMKFHRRLECVK